MHNAKARLVSTHEMTLGDAYTFIELTPALFEHLRDNKHVLYRESLGSFGLIVVN